MVEQLSDKDFWLAVAAAFVVICVGYFFLKGNIKAYIVQEAPAELDMLEDFEDLKRDISRRANEQNLDAYWARINAFGEWHKRYMPEEHVIPKVVELSAMLTRIESVHPLFN